MQETSATLYKSGDYTRALQAAEHALTLTIRRDGRDHERTGIATYSVGIVAEAAGRLDLAETNFRDSVRIREKVYGPDSAGTAQALENLAAVVLRQGRPDDAAPLYERVLRIRTELVGGQHAFTASARSGLGDVEAARRHYSTALAHYREAIRLLTAPRSTQTLARSVDDDQIRRHVDVFAGLASAAWQSATTPAQRTAMLAETFQASQQAWTTSAGAALARMSARLGQTDTDLGRRIRRSQDQADRVLALHEADMRALGAWHKIQRASPRYTALLEEFRQASIAQTRTNAPLVARQTALVRDLQALLAKCPPGRTVKGCETADAERQTITRQLGELSASTSKGSSRLMEIHGRMSSVERTLPGFAAHTTARNARLQEMTRLDGEQAEAKAEIVRTYPDYAALIDPKPLTPTETEALLQPDEALVTILVGRDKSFVWAISRQRASWAMIDAGAAEISAHVAALRQGLEPPAAADGQAGVVPRFDLARAHALYRLILGPVALELAGKQHVIIVPTGPLTSLPFQVLLTDPPRRTPPSTDADISKAMKEAKWLIRRHALSMLPSVQSLAALRKLAPPGAPPKPFLGIGNPVFAPEAISPTPKSQPRGPTPVSVPATSKPPRLAAAYRNGRPDLRALRNLSPLPETAYEVETIATVLGADKDAILLGEAANETRLKRTALDRYRTIHFATHGLVAGELSGLAEPALVLSLPSRPTDIDDGLLTASEIAALKLSADWVVLSACNTAAGATPGADALSGLARAFFHAGARGLLVSHWAVNSGAAVILTTHTFARMAKSPNMGRAEAFRRTMLELIDAGQPPTIWAPFVIIGEGAPSRPPGK
jgi:CHAT domain-containing protein/tetratricopeptide (TPR) repeat protein